MTDRKSWTQEEDQSIIDLVNKFGIKKWTEVSSNMETLYNLKARTGKQCRERWHNHLNPNINKEAWSEEEEQAIFDAHKKFGSKWAEISKHLNGRTDSSIKNHFYSTLRRSLRRINKYIGDKHSTELIKNIKPGVLAQIIQLADKEEKDIKDINENKLCKACKGIQEALMEFAHNKYTIYECNKEKQDEELMKEKILKTFLEKIMEFNNLYNKEKLSLQKNQKKQKNVKRSREFEDDFSYSEDLESTQDTDSCEKNNKKIKKNDGSNQKVIYKTSESEQSLNQSSCDYSTNLQRLNQIRKESNMDIDMFENKFEEYKQQNSTKNEFVSCSPANLPIFSNFYSNSNQSPCFRDNQTPLQSSLLQCANLTPLTPNSQGLFQFVGQNYQNNLSITQNNYTCQGLNGQDNQIPVKKNKNLFGDNQKYDSIVSQLKTNIQNNNCKFDNKNTNETDICLDLDLDLIEESNKSQLLTKRYIGNHSCNNSISMSPISPYVFYGKSLLFTKN